MKVHGRCHCGEVRYEAQIDPQQVSVCHCTDCQMLSGSAFRVSLQAPKESFRLLSGAPRVYVKTAESGARRAHAFCPTCGTPVHASAADGLGATYSLRVGCLEERAALAPQRQIWCRSALPWSRSLDEVVQLDRG